MKRGLNIILLFAMLLALAGFPATVLADAPDGSAGPRTYNVIVGAEISSQGIDVNAYFPGTVHVHVGDTVLWKQNTFEIHTVTFLAGGPMPDLLIPAPSGAISPLMINPQVGFPTAPADGVYDGSTFANSGVMGKDPGQPQSFSLTFSKTGSFDYVCLVHGMSMSGTIVVDDPSTHIPSPRAVSEQGRREMFKGFAQVPAVFRAALKSMKPPVKNPDGTKTYTIELGYMSGQVDLMRFFPNRLFVHPGDTVVWELSPTNDAPHTISFLNGTPDQPLTLVVPQPSGPPLLLINPGLLFPNNLGQPLTNQGYFNSGLLAPGSPSTSVSWTIGSGFTGKLPYMCLIHDESGMTGVLFVGDEHPDH